MLGLLQSSGNQNESTQENASQTAGSGFARLPQRGVIQTVLKNAIILMQLIR